MILNVNGLLSVSSKKCFVLRGSKMERYEVRQISSLTWGIYDHEEDETILETTRKGVEVYAEMMGLEV